MYKWLIRPLLFCFDAEAVHHWVVQVLKILYSIPGAPALFRLIFRQQCYSSPINCAGIEFPNRVGIAAGFDKNAVMVDVLAAMGFGHIEIGTVTPRPQPGNPRPRLFRLPQDKALINRMGFNNDGVDAVVERLKRRKSKVIIGGNIGKNTVTPNEKAYKDYLYCFERLYEYVDYFVVNVSCPNIASLHELQDKNQLKHILLQLLENRKKQPVHKPIFLKISPDLNDSQLDDVLEVVMEVGIEGVVVSNTTVKRDGLQSNPQRIKTIGAGGLSGLPLRDRSTELIRVVSHKTQGKLPIIGVGGIMNEQDAIEKIQAGATLVQIYTGFIYEGPFLPMRIKKLLAGNLK
ncbi:MAG: quinone-dependent dihydroorotate dehydrogenase [Bacteroidales bacterium]